MFNSAMTACSIEPSIRQVPRLYVNRMVERIPEVTGILYCVKRQCRNKEEQTGVKLCQAQLLLRLKLVLGLD